MTPEAKRLLSSTIRAIRARLLSDLHTATESAYRLSVRAHDAELSEAAGVKRKRLETWIAEQVRAETDSKRRRTADDFRREVEKQAAYTLLNRLVILRLMEAAGLHKPAVATGGWESQGYKILREIAPALIQGDEGEGYPFLLQERRWAYYVPQPIPQDAISHAPNSVRDLKILDPAVGSGHFLVVAFDLLVALYREEARHRGSSSPVAGTPAKGAGGEEAHDWTDRGVAFTMLGNDFSGRAHRFASVSGNKGSSVYPAPDHDLSIPDLLCAFNQSLSKSILHGLNPGLGFEVGDINRLPIFHVRTSDAIFTRVDSAFTEHESHREPSVEFRCPGPSPWRHAQDWAQAAVDRAEGEPLPPYEPQYDPEPPTDHLSFALGVALGRFGPGGEGILDPATSDLSHALPAGMLFLDGTLDTSDRRDGLGHPAACRLLDCWTEYGAAIAPGGELRDYLRTKFFEDVHRKMYENRPIHWPLSSAKRTFVAWVTIHRWTDSTLRVLLADHLNPTLTRLEGELNDLRAARDGADKKTAREAEKLFPKVQKSREELADFIMGSGTARDRKTGRRFPSVGTG